MRVAKVILPLTVLALTLAVALPASALELIPMRSGNGAVNTPDALITFRPYGCCTDAPPFLPADFAAAAGGPPAIVTGPAHPAWAPLLLCDDGAKWDGVAAGAPPNSALYAIHFGVRTECIDSAFLDFCWMADDVLGSPNNPAGVYINGAPVPGTAGGNFGGQTTVSGINITAYISTGANTLYIWNQDVGAAVSGINFSALVRVVECPVPTEPSTWSKVKARFD